MHTLSNEFITVQIANKGAELQSIYHKEHSLEYLWQAHAAWPKKSPVLFPIVGGLKNGKYNYKGKEYALPRHGFARDMEFEIESESANAVTFALYSNQSTKAGYPFDFVFRIIYTLNDTTLSISFIVENTGDELMYFSVGAHPAFAIPLQPGLQYNDYYIRFDDEEHAPRWPLTAEGLVASAPIPFIANDDKLLLNKSLFAEDAVILKNIRSSALTLRSDKSPHGVTVMLDGFPYLGLWAAKEADFICIEPWCGIADHENASGKLEEKEGIEQLDSTEVFTRTYTIFVF